ncbi:MAG: putative esterase [Oceanospirillaceae bacterium]|jgi:predicted esterase
MNSTEHLLKVERTARYRTLGELSPKTKTIWFALHGYGQLAKFFIRKFNGIVDDETFIVAPEGISRFYLDNKYDRIGASWITREHRDLEADEYIEFLNLVYNKITQDTDIQNITINVLGFSQGCATACRWLNDGHVSCEKLVLWAGFFTNGITDMISPEKLKETDTYYIYGEQDEFLVKYPEISEAFRNQMKEDIKPTVIPFEGTHRVDEKVLKELIDSWKK